MDRAMVELPAEVRKVKTLVPVAGSGLDLRVDRCLLREGCPREGSTTDSGKNMVIVNVGQLNTFSKDTTVDADVLLTKGIVKDIGDGIKLLGNGSIDYPLTVRVHGISRSARGKR